MRFTILPPEVKTEKAPLVVGGCYSVVGGSDCVWLLTESQKGYRWVNLSQFKSHDKPDDLETVKLDLPNVTYLGKLVVEDEEEKK